VFMKGNSSSLRSNARFVARFIRPPYDSVNSYKNGNRRISYIYYTFLCLIILILDHNLRDLGIVFPWTYITMRVTTIRGKSTRMLLLLLLSLGYLITIRQENMENMKK
jgi:NADH:ubiquinone oxidoreductase subunit 3 (subunit A)